MSAQVAADLRAAADVLERDGWTQGDYVTECGRCVMGAIAAALGGSYGETSVPYENHGRRYLALREIRNSVGTYDLDLWNDTHGRTAAEVIAALRAAADRAEADQ